MKKRGLATGPDGGYSLPGGSVLSPDAAWVEAMRVNGKTEEEQARFLPVCPDFVIELRSPGDRVAELEAKMEQWVRNGTRLGWLIDPEARTVAIYRPGQDVERPVAPSSVLGDGPVSGFCMVMARVWVEGVKREDGPVDSKCCHLRLFPLFTSPPILMSTSACT